MQRRTHWLPLTLLSSFALLLGRDGRAADAPGAAEPDAAPAEAASPPVAVSVAEAERLAAAAFDAYQQQQYERAVELYEQAWAAAPSADISFNIARVFDRGLHDARRACDHYRRYIADPSALPHRRRLAEQRVAELEAELKAAQEAELAAAAPLQLTPEAQTTGASDAPVALTPPPPPAPAERTQAWTPTEITALALGGAGVSALGIGVGFALSANAERDEWERGCRGNACTSQSAVDAARSAGRKADIATVALAAGGGLLAIGATLWWLSPGPNEGAPRAELRISPNGQATDLSCTLSGRF